MRILFAFVLVLTTSAANALDVLQGKVIEVIDGNTVQVQLPDETREFMLSGVDSPELTQEYGEKAKKYLEKLMLNQEVTIEIESRDRWGKYHAKILLKEKQTDPRIELLKEGLAWTAEKNPNPALEEVRVEAERKRRGIWKSENPMPPWTYRRQQTMLTPKSS